MKYVLYFFDIFISVCIEKMGMENKTIPDERIIASSVWGSHLAENGRLNGADYWAACKSAHATPWIQADIGYKTFVSGVITQGGNDEHWVTAIKVSTFLKSTDVEKFVTDEYEKVKVSALSSRYSVYIALAGPFVSCTQ